MVSHLCKTGVTFCGGAVDLEQNPKKFAESMIIEFYIVIVSFIYFTPFYLTYSLVLLALSNA